MRTRTDTISTVEPSDAVYKTYGGVCGNPERCTNTVNYPGTCKTVVQTRVTNDVVTPNYRKRIAAGEIINNPYDSTLMISTDTNSTIVQDQIHYSVGCTPVQNLWDGWTYDGKCAASLYLKGSYLPVPVLTTDRVRDIAVTSAWAKADVSDIAGLATLAEGKETIASLRSIFQRVVRIGRALKRKNLKALKREISFKNLQERYMEARYAIRPMAYDVVGILNAFNDTKKNGDRMTYRGYATDSSVCSRTDHVCYQSAYDKVTSAQFSSRSVSARSGILAKVDQLSKISIWGLEQLPMAVWEITPYSFILDWFFNVGKTVAAFTPKGGLRILASWVVVTETNIQQSWITSSEALWPTSNIAAKKFEVSGSMSDTVIVKRRLINPQVSPLPSCTVRLDAAKLLDLAIIIKQLVF